MTRRQLSFACEDTEMWGTLDVAPASAGLVIVSGGNEVRSGPWASQALLAARIAAAGFPVFRFDRRGVGDSAGANFGFRHSAADIASAIAAFRSVAPHVARIVGYGNCDAASALMLGGGAGCDALVLANPWTLTDDDADPAPAAVRAHYRRRVRDRGAIIRLLTGKVSLRALIGSLRQAAASSPENPLAAAMVAGLAGFAGPATILLAERDRTAQAFLGAWDPAEPRLRRCPDATHSFAEAQAQIWLQGQLLAALRAS